MEQPYSGFVEIDTEMFMLIRRDVRVVLRSAHLEQLEQTSTNLTQCQQNMLAEHRADKNIGSINVSTSISNAEARLSVVEPVVRPRRMSITDLFTRPDLAADGTGLDFKAQFRSAGSLRDPNSPREGIPTPVRAQAIPAAS